MGSKSDNNSNYGFKWEYEKYHYIHATSTEVL